MKIAFIVLVAAGLMFSCSHQPHDEAGHSTVHVATTELALNGEEKWQADEATNANMQELQQLMQDYLAQPDADSLYAINELGRTMQLGFQEVFNDCRMKGPEHDMLHTYLMPMLDDVKTLETDNPEKALDARNRLSERLGQYQTYFK